MGRSVSKNVSETSRGRRSGARRRYAKGYEVREQILEAALALFKRKGYPSTSMKDIADAVRLTKGGIYHHIEKKGDLLRELHDQMITAAFDRMRQTVDSEPDPKTQLAKWIRMHTSIMHDYLDQISVFFTEMEHLDRNTLKRMIRKRDEVHNRLADILRKGIDAKEFRDGIDPDVTALLVLGMINWFYQWYRPKGRLSLTEITDMTTEIVCHGVCK